MHEFKYNAVVTGNPMWSESAMNVRSEFLLPLARAFVANVDRTSAFAFMPAMVAGSVRREQLWVDCIELEMTGKLDPNFFKFLGVSPDGLSDRLNQMLKEFHIAHPDVEEITKSAAIIGLNYINGLLKSAEAMRESMTALLSSVILESWTAFESLASDLWATGVDFGPKELRLRVANSNKLLKPDDNIGAKRLLEAEFDPSKNFGSSLRELGRVSFQRLDYIKRFYSVAFSHDFEQMFKEVEGGYIEALAAFRNALIHNAGKADKPFTRQVSSFAELRSIRPNDPLLLDGELVKRLRNASMSLGTRLLQFVDGILSPAQ